LDFFPKSFPHFFQSYRRPHAAVVGRVVLDIAIPPFYADTRDRKKIIPTIDGWGCTAPAICGLHGRFLTGPARYAMLWHIGVLTGKSESRLLQDDDFHGNTKDAGKGSCLTECTCGCGCSTRIDA
jgi:hypothetical protein